jgi:glutamate decarboxylase
VIGQYFNFLHLGRQGFKHRMATLELIACHLADGINRLKPLTLLSHPLGQLPVFIASLDSSVSNWTVFDLSDKLRERGWMVPAYTMPADCEQLTVLRFVIRSGFSRDMAEQLLADIERAVEWFESLTAPIPRPIEASPGFHH